jgi:short-subunit dehydrogenase
MSAGNFPVRNHPEGHGFHTAIGPNSSTLTGMDPSLRVLVIGGYGVFGSRLIRLLADEEGVTLLVAGRSKSKAEAFCRSVTGRAEVLPADLRERDGAIAEAYAPKSAAPAP